MTVWKPGGGERLERVILAPPSDFETILLLPAAPVRKSWVPQRVELLATDERGRRWQAADIPYFKSYALALRPRAVDALGAIWDCPGELLPLVCEEAELTLFHNLTVVDALDEAGSEITRFDDGRIMRIDRHAFRSEAIAGVDVFTIPQWDRARHIYVGDGFKRAYEAAGLRGLVFRPVWSAESDRG